MKIGLMAGTGMDHLTPDREWSQVTTPFGTASIATVTIGGMDVLLVQRHGPGCNVPAHLVNCRANMWAMHQAGVTKILATAAVGSLREDLVPGDLAVLADFIDFTHRNDATIYVSPGDRVVHTDVTSAYCPALSASIEQSAANAGISLARQVVYLCVNGPRYETPAEIRMFAQWGADVVGMTGVPEVVLARELDICYASLAIVTNYAAGISKSAISHDEVVHTVAARHQDIQVILESTIAQLSETGNAYSLD